MNFKLTVALVIGLVLLAAAFFLIPKWFPAGPEIKDPSAATALISPKPSGIKTISFVRAGEQQVAFARADKGWELSFPVKAKAESWQVEGVADTLLALSYKDKFEMEPSGNKSGAATGTDKPRYLITFTDDSGKEHKLGLGKRTVGGIYATLNGGSTVYLLASDPVESLDKSPQAFREKNIREINTEKVASLTVARGDAGVTLTKSGDIGKWLITRPVQARADDARINDILGELKAIRATGFTEMTKDHPGTGLNPPVLTVTALVEDAPATTTTAPATASAPSRTPVTLEFGVYTTLIDKKNVYASIAGTSEVFTIDAKTFDKMNKGLQELRDPAITPAMVGQATEVTQTTNGKVAAKVVKKDGAWSLVSTPAPLKAGELEVGDWLGDIRNLRAIKFVDAAGDLKSIGLDPPVTRLELAVPGQSQHEVILVGRPETADKVTPMMRQGEPTVYLVQTGDAEKALRTELGLRDKAVERLSATRIRAITVTGPGAAAGGLELVREGTNWNVKKAGKSEKADDEKITALLAEFTPLTAAKYLAMDANVTGTPEVTATLTVAEEVAASMPASAPATLPGLTSEAAGPNAAKTVNRTLRLFKDPKGTWKAVWDGAQPAWTFEPTAALIGHLTKETYAVTTQPATQPAAAPGP